MYCAYITTIKEIHKHSNADRLQCCTIFGNNVIIDMSFKVGDRVVYFPVDGQLSLDFAFENNLLRVTNQDGKSVGGYLDPEKRNIKALRLRGEKSDGLILPIDCLSKYTDIETLQDGDQITTLNGVEICKKYIPKSNNRANFTSNKRTQDNNKNKESISIPYFSEHIDTAQLAYNEQNFHKGDIIYLTQKLHGTSFRVGNCLEFKTKKRNRFLKRVFRLQDKTEQRWKVVSGTRRVVLHDYNGGYYGSNAFRKKYNDFFADKLPKGMTIYGEIVGWVNETTPIMPKCKNSKIKDKNFSRMYGEETIFTYGCEPGENDCYIYRITMTNEDGVTIELPTEETIMWCERLGCKYVPLLEKFLYTTWEDLNERCAKYLDVPEPLSNGKHVTEGVVVRIDNRSTFTAYKTKSFSFKVLEGIIKDEADTPDIEEAQDLISTIYEKEVLDRI
jgi:RNA ligase (TIGR02306 family)